MIINNVLKEISLYIIYTTVNYWIVQKKCTIKKYTIDRR